MAFMAPLLLIGGGIAAAEGNRQQYKAAMNISNYNQSVANQNADMTAQAAAANKAVAERKKRAQLSTMQAQYGFAGVDLSGSPLLAMAESAANMELDIQTEEFNSLVDATKQRSQAQVYGYEAQQYKKAAKNAYANQILKTGNQFQAAL